MWLVHLAIGPKDDESSAASGTTPEPTRRCPECAEWILAAAQKCKHCGERVAPLPPPTPMRQQFDKPLRIDEIDR
jgi:rRNA maturation protein Nop10